MLIWAGRGRGLRLQTAFELESVFDSPVPALDDPGGFTHLFVTLDSASPDNSCIVAGGQRGTARPAGQRKKTGDEK